MKLAHVSPWLAIAFLLTACGELRSDKVPVDKDWVALSAAYQRLSPESFAQECADQVGSLIANNTICTFITHTEVLSEGQATSDVATDLFIAELSPGAAVQAVGKVDGESVEITLNGQRITTIPSAGPVTTPDGGTLQFRLRPGTFSGVKVYVYSCIDQTLQPIRCP